MAESIDRWLDRGLSIRVGERRKVAFMALYAANAIGAVVVGRTVRDTLFLSDRTTQDLPYAYIVNSIAVALLSWLYARVADRVRRDLLNSIVAAGWAVAMIGFFIAANISVRITAPVLYVAVEAMGALVVIQFWTFAQDVFTSREARRLFPVIGAGGQAANVFYGFLASSLSKRVSAESLLILCAINLAACALLVRYISRRFGHSGELPAAMPRSVERERSRPRGLRALNTPHLVTIALIGIVGSVAVNLVDYQFKAAAESHFISDKQAMGAYFGRFYAICGLAAFALQMLLTGRILDRIGVLYSLLPLPICMAIGSAFAWLLPAGWTVVLAKGSDSIFRYTISDASTQLLYVPVPPTQRGQAKALIDGVLKPMSGVIAGLLLVGLSDRSMRQMITLPGHGLIASPDGITTAMILVLCLGWIGLMLRDRQEYVQALLETLQKRRLDPQDASINAEQFTTEAIAKVLRSNDALAILYALELMQHIRGRDFGPLVAELLDHGISSVRAAAADHLAKNADHRYGDKLRALLSDNDPWCVASAIGAICALEQQAAIPGVKPFLTDPRPALRAAAVIGLVRDCGVNGVIEAAEELKRLLAAEARVERELAASVLGALNLPSMNEALLRYLDDPAPSVRRAALEAAAQLKSPELVAPVVKLLARRRLGREAAHALAQFGPGVELQLRSVVLDDVEGPEVRRAALVVLGRIGTKEASDILIAALEIDDARLRATAARALARLRRRRSDITIRRDVVSLAVEAEIRNAEHYVNVQRLLRLPPTGRNASLDARWDEGGALLLALALDEERDRSIHRAIALLELLHPNAGLDVVADNLQSDSAARRANAVEVLDNTLREDLKKRLLLFVEDRQARSLPAPRSRGEWLSELIAGANPWIAACAAQVAREQQEPGVARALRNALASPIPYVREACAAALARVAPEEARAALPALRNDPSRSVRVVVEDFFATPLPVSA